MVYLGRYNMVFDGISGTDNMVCLVEINCRLGGLTVEINIVMRALFSKKRVATDQITVAVYLYRYCSGLIGFVKSNSFQNSGALKTANYSGSKITH